MNDNKIKEAMSKYIEDQTEKIMPENQETRDLTTLDEKVYATLNASQEKKKTTIVWSYKKITTIAASFLLIIGLSITFGYFLNKEPEHIIQDTASSIIISYENEQYGYCSNRIVIDKYGIKAVPDLIAGYITEKDIILVDSTMDSKEIIGAEIHPFNENVIIIRGRNGDYYFEKITGE